MEISFYRYDSKKYQEKYPRYFLMPKVKNIKNTIISHIYSGQKFSKKN